MKRRPPLVMPVPRLGLTPMQADCARVIAELTGADDVAPTYDEIANELGLSSRGRVAFLVDELCTRGWAIRGKGRSRSVRMLAVPELPPEPALELTETGRAALQ